MDMASEITQYTIHCIVINLIISFCKCNVLNNILNKLGQLSSISFIQDLFFWSKPLCKNTYY